MVFPRRMRFSLKEKKSHTNESYTSFINVLKFLLIQTLFFVHRHVCISKINANKKKNCVESPKTLSIFHTCMSLSYRAQRGKTLADNGWSFRKTTTTTESSPTKKNLTSFGLHCIIKKYL